jgi:hypothetical protein
MARAALASLVALIVVTACGALGGRGSGPLAPPSPPTAALQAWKDFPAHANPRPIIWFGGVAEHVSGFADSNSKNNWICGKFVLGKSVQLPSAGPARATARWPSGAEASYPSVGAEPAFKAVLSDRHNAGNNCASAADEAITEVRWGTAGFSTDRGIAQMSAWLFEVGAVNGELGYPALDPSAYWGGAPTANSGSLGGHISSDGLTLTIGLIGGPDTPGPCGEDFAAAAAESDSAVAVAISSRIHGGPGVGCTLEGHFRTVTVALAKPLDGRVVIDEKGNVGGVCPERGGR